jgi:hypothetical protein
MRFSNKMASLTGDVAFRQSSMAQMQPGKYIAFAAEKMALISGTTTSSSNFSSLKARI